MTDTRDDSGVSDALVSIVLYEDPVDVYDAVVVCDVTVVGVVLNN